MHWAVFCLSALQGKNQCRYALESFETPCFDIFVINETLQSGNIFLNSTPPSEDGSLTTMEKS